MPWHSICPPGRTSTTQINLAEGAIFSIHLRPGLKHFIRETFPWHLHSFPGQLLAVLFIIVFLYALIMRRVPDLLDDERTYFTMFRHKFAAICTDTAAALPSIFRWIIMRYIIFASSWHDLVSMRGNKIGSQTEKVLPALPYLCMPNLWKFDVLVSYFGGILLYLFAHNRNTCFWGWSCRCAIIPWLHILFLSLSIPFHFFLFFFFIFSRSDRQWAGNWESLKNLRLNKLLVKLFKYS